MLYGQINWIAVFASAVIAMVSGFLWYGPLFGKQWMKLMGFTKSDMEKAKAKGMGKSYGMMLVSAVVMSYVLAIFVSMSDASSAVEGAIIAFWTWLGFVATVSLSSVLWENKSYSLYYLNVGYYLVSLVLMGALLATWR